MYLWRYLHGNLGIKRVSASPPQKGRELLLFFHHPKSQFAQRQGPESSQRTSVASHQLKSFKVRCLMRVKPGVTIMSVKVSKYIRLKHVSSLNEAKELDLIYHSSLGL